MDNSIKNKNEVPNCEEHSKSNDIPDTQFIVEEDPVIKSSNCAQCLIQ